MISLVRHPSLVVHVLRHPGLFVLGWREARGSSGLTFDNDPCSSRSLAYDSGRDLRLRGRA